MSEVGLSASEVGLLASYGDLLASCLSKNASDVVKKSSDKHFLHIEITKLTIMFHLKRHDLSIKLAS